MLNMNHLTVFASRAATTVIRKSLTDVLY
ncbi:hypothetical protein LINPERHAP1_LOCUS23228 [Linum perenne]